MEPSSSGLAVLTRPSIQEQDNLRRNFGGRPQIPLHEAFGSPDEAADAYCSNALQRKILQVLATPSSSGAKAKGLMLAEIAHKIVIEEEVVLKCLVAEYSPRGLFTAVRWKGPGKRAFAVAPLADWISYPPGMQPCTLWALSSAALRKAGAVGLTLEDLRQQVLTRGFQGFESLPDEMCDVMLRGVLSGEVAGGSVLQLPSGKVALASCIKAQPPQELPEEMPSSFHDVKEKGPKLANGASAAVNGATVGEGMQTPPRHSVDSPTAAEATNPGAAILRQTPRKPGAAPSAAVNTVEYFGQGMLRKTTTASEGSPRPPEEPPASAANESLPSGAGRTPDAVPATGDAGTASPLDHARLTGSRPAFFKGPSIPTTREADITPAILKHVERAPAPAPEAPTPLSPAILKHRPRSPPRTTAEPPEVPVLLSPALLKKRDKPLDPVTPPNKEPSARSPVSPNGSEGHAVADSEVPDKMKAAVAALSNSQPGIPLERVQSLVRDMIAAPALARRLRTKMMLEGFAREQVDLKGGLDTAIQDAMSALSLAS